MHLTGLAAVPQADPEALGGGTSGQGTQVSQQAWAVTPKPRPNPPAVTLRPSGKVQLGEVGLQLLVTIFPARAESSRARAHLHLCLWDSEPAG